MCVYVCIYVPDQLGRKEMFYLWLYDIRHMVKDHSDGDRGNALLPLHGLYFFDLQQGIFCNTNCKHISWPFLIQSWNTGWNEK